jgi:CBS domain-containing protein
MMTQQQPGTPGAETGIPACTDSAPATSSPVTAAKLMHAVPPASLDTSNEKVLEMFSQHPELQAIPVVDGGVPVGIIGRHAIAERFAPLFRLYGEKAHTCFMDTAPVVVEQDICLQELCRTLAAADLRHLTNGFIITDRGQYIGMGTVHDLVYEIAQLLAGR